ncbi:MAG: helix-turn-helix domain-containing protein [Trueperaceae bacterium]
MWLEDRFRLCPVSGKALVLHGGEEYGAPFLVDRLRRERAVAWLAFTPAEASDRVAAGNKLADAVNEAVEGNLLQHALPYLVHLRSLSLRRTQLPPFTLVVSGADLAPEFAQAAAQACRSGFGLWLLASDGPSGFDGPAGIDALHLRPSDLRLTLAEARRLAPSGIGDGVVARIHDLTEGAYTRFLGEMHKESGLPEIMVPHAEGWVYPEHEARREHPEDVVEALLRLGRQVDALEVAAESLPGRVEELLHEAGPEFQNQGLLPRLHLLLSTLPPPYDERERTLEWRLVAAHQAGAAQQVAKQVRRYLSVHEAPELRARYAAFAPYSEGLNQARRAATALPSPLTLWQYGRMLPDPSQGIELLTRSVSQAELEGDPYACVRAAGTLAARFLHLGDFHSGRSWADWGLQLYDENALRDGIRRLHLFKELAFARTMLGELSGLREQLQDGLATVENVLPDMASSYRDALADLERLEADPLVAAEYTKANLDTSPRRQKGLRAHQHVRSLLELGKVAEAADVARAAAALSAGASVMQDLRARLAVGMVQAFEDPDSAAGTLTEIMENPELIFDQRARAALHYLLARPSGAGDIPENLRSKLENLSDTALRVLSGPPEAFHKIWMDLTGGRNAALELRVLGKTSARLEGVELRLTRRQWEILVALALHPEGLGYDALHAFLLQDDNRLSPGTLRSHVSHLRSIVPISDNPYRIEVPYTLDIAAVQAHLREGKVRQAIALVNGSVLPSSSLPGIRDTGEQLDQALRESVLTSGDPEALYCAASLWNDDLEVWEATLAALHPRDPRVPLLRARVQSLRHEYGAA